MRDMQAMAFPFFSLSEGRAQTKSILAPNAGGTFDLDCAGRVGQMIGIIRLAIAEYHQSFKSRELFLLCDHVNEYGSRVFLSGKGRHS
jgi:hypothetical protein